MTQAPNTKTRGGIDPLTFTPGTSSLDPTPPPQRPHPGAGMPTLTNTLDALLTDAVDNELATGIYVMAANQERVIYSGGAGLRDGQEPWREDTLAWLASMTKAIIAIATLQLVEQGALELDVPITNILPELTDPDVLDGYDGNRPRLRKARFPITLRALLSHTDGSGYPFLCPTLDRYCTEHAVPSSLECRLATLVDTPLIEDPGSGFSYGMGLEWAGLAISRVTGRDLPSWLTEHILNPLGMTDTAFGIVDRARLAKVYASGPEGPLPLPFELPRNPETPSGGGGLYGSPRDYLTFARMVAAGGTLGDTTILSPDTMREACRSQTSLIGPIPSHDKNVSYDIDLVPGTPTTWSLLGMRNEEPTPQGRPVGTVTWGGGANTYFWADLNSPGGTSAVFFTQTVPFADPALINLWSAVEHEIRVDAALSGQHRPRPHDTSVHGSLAPSAPRAGR
jgi:methyl acetate hydrolase